MNKKKEPNTIHILPEIIKINPFLFNQQILSIIGEYSKTLF